MVTFLKERRNAWYGTSTHYFAEFIAEIPFMVTIPFIFCSIVWYTTGQITDNWRFLMFSLICILLSSTTQALGMIIGIIFINNVNAAVFMAPLSLTPFFLMGGFFVNFDGISFLMKPVALLSFIRYAFEAVIVLIYGFNRCSSKPTYVQRTKIMTRLSCFWASREFGDNSISSHSSSPNRINLTSWNHESLPDFNWMSMIKSLTLNDLSLDQSDWIGSIVDISSSCVSEVIKQLQNFLGSSDEQSQKNTLNNKITSGSYMMTHWELNEDKLWTNLMAMVTILIGLRMSSYFLLQLITNKRLRNM